MGKISWSNQLKELRKGSFDSFDLVVNNSSYSPEYLSKIYLIDYYKILISVQKKIEQQIEQANTNKVK
ncbi:MAG: hypothetical protein ACRBFS_19480 [Aureispira sp.]